MKATVSPGYFLPFHFRSWKTVTLALLTVSATSASSSWSRTWTDEFDNTAIDTQKWTVLEGDGCDSYLDCGWDLGQIAVASKNNTYINEDGHLVVVARYTHENISAKHQSYDDNIITSARLSTFGSADFLHGRVEVRAKVARGGWGGWSGIWLLPSEDQGLPQASCARVNVVEITKDAENSATASLYFGGKDSGCVSSDVWPYQAGECTLSLATNVALSDDFHVYALEWDENEFRWFLDGMHYCTKDMWFSGLPDAIYPAPFDKTFHIEIGLAVGGWRQSVDSCGAAVDTSAMPEEMLVDYGPSGSWWTPPEGISTFAYDRNPRSMSALHLFVLDIIALAACVFGPFMAITGLSRFRFNTWLMGVEIGAFKAANIFYIVSGSFMMAFIAGILFGIISGYLAVKHQAMARWNTVGALSVPTLFMLIDIGMISEIGSRYACWAIFGVLTVTYAMLAFPAEHHTSVFRVASAATGSCVLKLGLGRLMGTPGEIFKLFDDPVGDRCHESRICQTLGWVSLAMFIVGLWVQWSLAHSLQTSTPLTGTYRDGTENDSRTFSACPKSMTPAQTRVNEALISALKEADELQDALRQLEQGSFDGSSPRTKNLDQRTCGSSFTGFESILRRFVCFSSKCKRSFRGVNWSNDGSPTLVPEPFSRAYSNTTASSKEDAIELVVHGHNVISPRREPCAKHTFFWQRNTGNNGATKAKRERELSRGKTRLVGIPCGGEQRLPTWLGYIAPSQSSGHGNVDRGKRSSGELAEAFSEKWGSWVGDRFPNDNSHITGRGQQRLPSNTGGGEGGSNTITTTKTHETAHHRARKVDCKALSPNPSDFSCTTTSPADSSGIVENVVLSSGSSSSSIFPFTAGDDEWEGNITPTYYDYEHDNVVCVSYPIVRKEASPPRNTSRHCSQSASANSREAQ